MNREIISKNVHIDSLKYRMATYSKELKKKEKTIQNLSDNFYKLMDAHEKNSIEKETQDKKINKIIEKFNITSKLQRELDTERKQHAIFLKELSESEQLAVKEKRNAEDCARKADIEKKKAENDGELANMKIKQLEKEKLDLQIQKDEIIEQQKLAKTV
ncbi:calponin homology domain-containing protein DDB_G0272472-like [Mytilus californianus]|uniref:calponin homology domain-containing protein DDB_G0272472-like n=1 Tax=Mytilus californianus TaxID=6549 RepID=UPI002247FE4B|nr:calponin homology domain-containing protein DDB_G0272472-like [Mytilus californianus]